MDDAPAIPAPEEGDDDDVAWALQTAAVQWNRGGHADAVVWVRRAVDAAIATGNARRTQDLTRLAARLAERVAGQAVKAAASRPPPPPSATRAGSDVDDLLDAPVAPVIQVGPRASAESLTNEIPIEFEDELIEDADLIDDEEAEGDEAAGEEADDDLPTIPPPAGSQRAPAIGEPSLPPAPMTGFQAPQGMGEDEPFDAASLGSERADPQSSLPPALRVPESERARYAAAAPAPLPAPRRPAVSVFELDDLDAPAPLPPQIIEPSEPSEPGYPPPGDAAPPEEPWRAERAPSEPPAAEAPATDVVAGAPPPGDHAEASSEAPASDVVDDGPGAGAEPGGVDEGADLDLGAMDVPAADSPPEGALGEEPPPADLPGEAEEPVPEPSGPPSVGGIALEEVPGLADLPEESQAMLAASAELTTLQAEEEVGAFGAALVVQGRVGVMPSIADVAASVAGAGQVVFTHGSLDDGVSLRVVALEEDTVVATWSPEQLAGSMADCPWVADELRLVADRFQSLAGATLGPLGERLDDSLRELVFSRLEVRAFGAGEVVVTAGKPVPGLHIVGAGRVELCEGDAPVDEAAPGDVLFAAEVLGAGKPSRSARAGKGGALVLVAPRSVAHELMMSVPPLLEILAG